MDDLFGDVPQPECMAPEQLMPLTADDVRAKMVDLVAIVRTAKTLPLESREWKQHVAMFPIMAQWLAPEEGEQLVLEFEREVERLRRAA